MNSKVRQLTLRHLIFDSKKHIGFEFSSDNTIEALLKSFDDITWSEKHKMWYVHNTKTFF